MKKNKNKRDLFQKKKDKKWPVSHDKKKVAGWWKMNQDNMMTWKIKSWK